MTLQRILLALLIRLSPLFRDELYIKMRYRIEMGRKLDFNKCRTMNEKLQWLKINNRYPEMTDIVDKIKVKKIISKMIGSQYVVPTLKVWDSADDINICDIARLPEKFVIKTNHSGGNTGVIICKDKSKLDLIALRKKLDISMQTDIYQSLREWPYKNVERRIFAEEYLGDNIVDYKFYCFDGYVDSVMLCLGRQSAQHTKFYFFNKDWKLCRYNKSGKEAPADFTLPKPYGMDKMFEIAATLSKGHPFIRVDLYNVSGQIYFGELTFFPASGFDPNRLPETDLYFGDKINLSLAQNTTS